jgi:quinoprotein glucose dehydrogenase
MRRCAAALAAVLLLTAACSDAPIALDGPVAGWPYYGGDAGGSRHSPLTQITRENVADLEVAWTFHTGDVIDGSTTRGKGAFQATPVLHGETLYLCSPKNRVFAVDAESGVQRWVYDPGLDTTELWQFACRGVAVWEDPKAREGQRCATRVFTGTLDARLIALDAANGRPCPTFGDEGVVDLTTGLGEIAPGEYAVTSPPTLVGDVVAVGALVGDGRRTEHPGGVVRGFDARTGALRWAFDPVPPGTPALLPGADGTPNFHRGTPNAWAPFAADPARDLLFVPMGNAGPDYYGGERRGLDFYASAVVALRGSTGEVVWHFQTVHHDLWDYDVASQPLVADVAKDGAMVPAVVQATKMGHVFVLHRETGVPLWPVEERAVPQTDVPGEHSSPTQPFPTHPKPLHPHRLEPAEVFGLTPWDRAACREAVATLRNEGIFTPPSLRGSVHYPGPPGGMNWGGVAFDASRALLVTNQSRIAFEQRPVPRAEADTIEVRRPIQGLMPQAGTPYAHRLGAIVSPVLPIPIPCSPPPWGTLLAVDLATGEKRWEVPFGSTRGQAPFPFWLELGMPNMGGPLTTASGVGFIGAAMDGSFRAFDVETGETLAKWRLPAPGHATPMTVRLRPDARQFVVIAAGGHGTLSPWLGDALVAFALPR